MPNSELFNGTEFLNESHSVNMIRVWKEFDSKHCEVLGNHR
jgi:hypothetical protein